MARETKFGFLFVIVLTGVFGMLVYKRMHEPLGLVAATGNATGQEETAEETPGDDSAPAMTPPGNAASSDPGLLAPVVDLAPQRPASPSTLPSPAGAPLAALPRGNLTLPEAPAAKALAPATATDDPFGETTVQSTPTKPKLPTSVDEDFFSSPTSSAPAATAQTTTPANPALTPTAAASTKTTESAAQDDPFGFSASDSPSPAPKELASPGTPATAASSLDLSSPSTPTNETAMTPANSAVAANEEGEEEKDPFGTPGPAMTADNSGTMAAREVSSSSAATGAEANSADSFDPFTGKSTAAATPVTEQKIKVEEEADPFEAPIEMKPQGSATLPIERNDNVANLNSVNKNVAGSPALPANSEADPFADTKEPQVPSQPDSLTESASSEMKAPSQADPFDSAPVEQPAPGPKKLSAAPALEFEADEFNAAPASTAPARSVPTATPKVAEPTFDPLDEPATTTSSPSPQGSPRMTPLPTEADPFETASSSPVEQLAALPQPTLPRGETRTATTALPTLDPEPQPVPRTNPIPSATGTTAKRDEDFPSVTRSAPVPALENTGSYVVQPGDNYWTISKQLYGSGRYFQALAKHNASVAADPQKLKPGMQIATPPGSELETRYRAEMPLTATNPTATSQPTNSGGRAPRDGEADPGFFLDSDGVPRYRIGTADTLSLIARNHLGRSSRWVQIYEMNRDILKDGNTLSVGTVLHLPPDASQVQSVMSSPASR